MFPLGEEEKNEANASGMLVNKHSWIRTKGLFTDLSPINSLGSHVLDRSSSRQGLADNTSSYQTRARKKRLQDVEEEQTEILGTHQASPYP